MGAWRADDTAIRRPAGLHLRTVRHDVVPWFGLASAHWSSARAGRAVGSSPRGAHLRRMVLSVVCRRNPLKHVGELPAELPQESAGRRRAAPRKYPHGEPASPAPRVGGMPTGCGRGPVEGLHVGVTARTGPGRRDEVGGVAVHRSLVIRVLHDRGRGRPSAPSSYPAVLDHGCLPSHRRAPFQAATGPAVRVGPRPAEGRRSPSGSRGPAGTRDRSRSAPRTVGPILPQGREHPYPLHKGVEDSLVNRRDSSVVTAHSVLFGLS